MRYIGQDGTVEPPISFIPLLESAMTIKYVDFFVFEEVCRIIQDFIKSDSPVFPISVKLLTIHTGGCRFSEDDLFHL